MPTYLYKCNHCCVEFEVVCKINERVSQRCNCGKEGIRLFKGAPGLSIFRAGYYRDVGPDGVYANTPQELQDACNKNGVYSSYIENSLFKVRKDYDGFEEKRRAESGR